MVRRLVQRQPKKNRVIRGASFNQAYPGMLQSSVHAGKPPGAREYNVGFRCVVTVGASSAETPPGGG